MKTRMRQRLFATAALLGSIALIGCGDTSRSGGKANSQAAAQDEVAKERSALSAEDRALVEAQEWCVVQNDERLGSMGPPLKLTVKGETVFVCCSGCKKKAEENPEKTLSTVKELKAKKVQQSTGK